MSKNYNSIGQTALSSVSYGSENSSDRFTNPNLKNFNDKSSNHESKSIYPVKNFKTESPILMINNKIPNMNHVRKNYGYKSYDSYHSVP